MDRKEGSSLCREELETLMALGRPYLVRFQTEAGAATSIKTRILKVYDEDNMTYILMEGGIRIAVTNLIDVEGFSCRRKS